MPGILGPQTVIPGRTDYPTTAEQADKMAAMLMGGLDVFGLPSAAAGAMGLDGIQAEMRGPQERNPGYAFAGSLPVAGRAANAVMAGGKAAWNAVKNSPSLAAVLLSGVGAAGLGATSADALTKKQKNQLDIETAQAKIAADKEAARVKAEADAETAKRLGEVEAERVRKDNELKAAKAEDLQAEYNNEVKMAEIARDKELGRVRRFSDTTVGKGMEALGGSAPVVAGGLAGMLARGAGQFGGPVMKLLTHPVVSGALTGLTAANIPTAYNAIYTDADNPNKAAYSAYGRELPPTHPRKQEFIDYANSLPDKNPVHSEAYKELTDPWRLGLSVVEGIGGAGLGYKGASFLANMLKSKISAPATASNAVVHAPIQTPHGYRVPKGAPGAGQFAPKP